MKDEKYLPIGTVVLLKKGKKRLMITGYCMSMKEGPDSNKEFDYSGCLFPEGIQFSDENYLFNHDQIDQVFWFGLINQSSKEYISAIKDIQELQNNNK